MKIVEPANVPCDASTPPAPEQLSALFDGQLSLEQARSLVRASLQDDALLAQWRSISIVAQALHHESAPTLIAEAPSVAKLQAKLHAAAALEAANDSVFRWRLFAGIAALATIGSLVWSLLGQQSEASGSVLAQLPTSQHPTLVQASSSQFAASMADQPLVMIRDPRLDELLAAHRQFGGMSALQQPAGSLRSASLSSERP